MPLYEYLCNSCGHAYEEIVSISAADKQKCPKCNKKATKLVGGSDFRLSGRGWYETDFKTTHKHRIAHRKDR